MIARRLIAATLFAGALAFAAPAIAQKPAKAPGNATAQCNDGTYSTAKTERGACSKHGGVKTWWGGAAAKPAAPRNTETTTAPPKGASPSKGGTAAMSTAPNGATGQCADGSYTRAKTQRGACSKHGGVKKWFGQE